MLRRRFITMIGLLVFMLVATAIIGIWVLEGSLTQLDHVNDEVMGTFEQVNDLVIDIRDVRRGLHELQTGHKDQAGSIIANMDKTVSLMDSLSQSSLINQPPIDQAMGQVQTKLPEFQKIIADLLASKSDVSSAAIDAAMAAANSIDQDATRLSELVRHQAHMEHQQLSERFRRQVLVLAVIAIVVINLSIIALLRLATMILKPVDSLVVAAHELGLGHFETRVDLVGNDEFGQLGRAYNGMAEQLQAAEKRRMEVLSQVALTMNHELNNAINIIELQLVLLSRRAGDAATQQVHLKQIRTSLARMTRVVEALRHTRRIVLTDYMSGVKMLDLRKSTEENDVSETEAAELAPAGTGPEYDL